MKINTVIQLEIRAFYQFLFHIHHIIIYEISTLWTGPARAGEHKDHPQPGGRESSARGPVPWASIFEWDVYLGNKRVRHREQGEL